ANVGVQLAKLAKDYAGETDGRIADPAVRDTVLRLNMHRAAFQLTTERANEENRTGTPAEATSIFKLVGAALQQDTAELR
ncbi:hypothetical protein, partial [Enterococcus casseliflavus]|uniref:hypothetical protein n=1 Tax=Enterococcus casseliflavus TaxID=37734 RepID=UPI003D114133